MKNIMSRNEYLQKVDEGFIKDTLKKGIDKVKSMFTTVLRKVKGMIRVIDNEGNVLPIITPQAIIDLSSKSDAVNVYSTQAMNDSVRAAGGKGCKIGVPEIEDNGEVYDLGPDGSEYWDWIRDEKYKDTREYKNFMTMVEMLNEGLSGTEGDPLNESWEDAKKTRIPYNDKRTFEGFKTLDSKSFKSKIRKAMTRRIRMVKGDESLSPEPNMLIFGAPGIGKTTMVKQVVSEYNKELLDDPSSMVAIILIDCGMLAEGDFLMPTAPKNVDVVKNAEDSKDSFRISNDILSNSSEQEIEGIRKAFDRAVQSKTEDVPKSWVPVYKNTGDDKANAIANEAANSFTWTSDEKSGRKSYKTTGGGLIVFDELLRADEGIFRQMMNLLSEREIQGGWKLGDKWTIVATSNRPCDDNVVKSVWSGWSKTPAASSRFPIVYQLVPDPDGWKEWMLKKNTPEIILDFIFEPESKVDGEYPRWHTTSQSSVRSVLPRNWEYFVNKIHNHMSENGIKKFEDISPEDIYDEASDVFDTSFAKEFETWIVKRLEAMKGDKLKKVVKNFDKKTDMFTENGDVFVKKQVLASITNEIKVMLKKQDFDSMSKNEIMTYMKNFDKEYLTPLIIWCGINLKNDYNIVKQVLYTDLEATVFNEKSKTPMSYVKNFTLLSDAAYPEKADFSEESVKFCDDNFKDVCGSKGFVETCKDYMRKYFPWRIDDDGEINYYDELEK